MTIVEKLENMKSKIDRDILNTYFEINTLSNQNVPIQLLATHLTRNSYDTYIVLMNICHSELSITSYSCKLISNTLKNAKRTIADINHLSRLLSIKISITQPRPIKLVESIFELLLKATKDIKYLIEILTEKDLIHIQYHEKEGN